MYSRPSCSRRRCANDGTVVDGLARIRAARLGAGDVVAEEDGAAGREPAGEPVPKLFESLGQDVRDEEREENQIESLVRRRRPFVEICMDVLDLRVADTVAVDSERARGRVDGDHRPCPGGEMACEQPRAGGQLEHGARHIELVHGGLEPGRLLEPTRVPFGPKVIDAAAVPNVVVLGCAVLVVPMLFVQDLLDLWFHPFAPLSDKPSEASQRPPIRAILTDRTHTTERT